MIFTTKKPENLLSDALCHKLTIYKQFSTYKFKMKCKRLIIKIKYMKKIIKPKKVGKLEFWYH